MSHKILIRFCCLCISFLFAYTGTSKLLSLPEFEGTLSHIPFVRSMGIVPAILIPVSELLLAVLLLSANQLPALVASLVLLFAFTAYIGVSLLFHSPLPCSCGGVIASMSWTQHLVFNLLFILIALIGINVCMHQNRGSRKPAE